MPVKAGAYRQCQYWRRRIPCARRMLHRPTGINRQHCTDNLKVLRENPRVRDKVVAIFRRSRTFAASGLTLMPSSMMVSAMPIAQP
ncbi:hypothetical protein KCP70_01465 [Salmonella enterica subsp. enterica]|nr:hypothetical protein KCP70_01465 [Salmonella enterica subsp. enterica]